MMSGRPKLLPNKNPEGILEYCNISLLTVFLALDFSLKPNDDCDFGNRVLSTGEGILAGSICGHSTCFNFNKGDLDLSREGLLAREFSRTPDSLVVFKCFSLDDF
uniref:Uncharacterized protein n=1 Tax=Cacopsylla melanoneura TaxID=428564 RepID=A0A8D8QDX9_9HEMI